MTKGLDVAVVSGQIHVKQSETQVYVKSLHSHHHDDDYLPDASFLTHTCGIFDAIMIL